MLVPARGCGCNLKLSNDKMIGKKRKLEVQPEVSDD
jgi:hypothetical protein